MKKILIITAISAVIFACNNNEVTWRTNGFAEVPEIKEDSLYKDVMDGHDVGMAKMGKVKNYLQRTQQYLDSLNKLPANNNNRQLQQAATNIKEDLNYAVYAMDTWMEEFNPDSATGNMANSITYLQNEKVKVNKVKAAILKSLQKADSLFAIK
jgi:hypothetical protein